jgi:hypothetical protein
VPPRYCFDGIAIYDTIALKIKSMPTPLINKVKIVQLAGHMQWGIK